MADKYTFKDVHRLYYWCNKVLPTVYDDSLSYYELLNKIALKLNTLIENYNELPEYIVQEIAEMLQSEELGAILQGVISNFMLNVKYPPAGITPAVGDGAEDDTEAIQGCIDWAAENGGGAVYIPAGWYLTQSITLKENVSLIGYDRYATVFTLKGGATEPLVTAQGANTIAGITLNANTAVQTEYQNALTVVGEDHLIRDVILDGGNYGLESTSTGHLQINNVIVPGCVVAGLYLHGSAQVQAENVMVEDVSEIAGDASYIINNNNGTYQIGTIARVDEGIVLNGNGNYVQLRVENATTKVTDNGTNNQYLIETEGDNVTNALLEGLREDIDAEAEDRAAEITRVEGLITAEETAREAADELLNTSIEGVAGDLSTEVTNRTNADNALDDRIDGEIADRIAAINQVETMISASEYYINVKDHGAVGDGVTDDTVAVQTAVNQVGVDGRRTVYFPPGTYVIRGCYKGGGIVLKSNMTLLFDNATVLVHRTDASSVGAIFMTAPFQDYTDTGYNGLHDIKFIGMTFDGNYTDQTPTTYATGNVGLCHNRDIDFINCTFKRGLNTHYIDMAACLNVRITNCTFYGGYANGDGSFEAINIDWATEAGFPMWGAHDGMYCQNVYIRGCLFSNFTGDNTFALGNHTQNYTAMSAEHRNIIITDNIFTNMSRTIRLNYSFNVTIANNIFANFANMSAENTTPYSVWIQDNRGWKIVNNTFYRSVRNAIFIACNPNEHQYGGVILDNEFYTIGSDDFNTAICIRIVRQRDVLVSNNNFRAVKGRTLFCTDVQGLIINSNFFQGTAAGGVVSEDIALADVVYGSVMDNFFRGGATNHVSASGTTANIVYRNNTETEITTTAS